MLFFLIILLISLIIILIIFSSFKLIITNLEISNQNNEIKPIYEVKLAFYLLGKIQLFAIKINNKNKNILKNDFIKNKLEQVKKANQSKRQKQIQKEIIINILKILEIEEINLNISIDTTNVILT